MKYKHPVITLESPLTCAQIAAQLGRNPVSIFRAIRRLNIEAALTTPGGFRFYTAGQIKTIAKGMRQPNRKKAGSNGR